MPSLDDIPQTLLSEICLKNGSEAKVPKKISDIGFVAALLCSIFGSIINGGAMFVILRSSKFKKHLTTPLLFFQSLNDFGYCSIFLALEAFRWYQRENVCNMISEGFCNFWPIFGFSMVGVSYWNLSLISINRNLASRNRKLGTYIL